MYRDALREAIVEEMGRDSSVFIIGEGIAERGGSYKVTEGLLDKYGAKRVRDTPIAEAGMIGVGVGAAIAGARPIVEILYVAYHAGHDMLVNQAKFRLMTGEAASGCHAHRGRHRRRVAAAFAKPRGSLPHIPISRSSCCRCLPTPGLRTALRRRSVMFLGTTST
jgi:pyruvate/2-oxoglutarate/acetoin dehydrogenase E1 component